MTKKHLTDCPEGEEGNASLRRRCHSSSSSQHPEAAMSPRDRVARRSCRLDKLCAAAAAVAATLAISTPASVVVAAAIGAGGCNPGGLSTAAAAGRGGTSSSAIAAAACCFAHRGAHMHMRSAAGGHPHYRDMRVPWSSRAPRDVDDDGRRPRDSRRGWSSNGLTSGSAAKGAAAGPRLSVALAATARCRDTGPMISSTPFRPSQHFSFSTAQPPARRITPFPALKATAPGGEGGTSAVGEDAAAVDVETASTAAAAAVGAPASRNENNNNRMAATGGVDDKEEWNTFVEALQMYGAAYGDLKVPTRFVVPSMPPWPESAWNLKLGQRVASVRSTGKFVQDNEKRRKLLDDMNFLWRLRAPSKRGEREDAKMDHITVDQIVGALSTYKEVHGGDEARLVVPHTFVVPDCDPWPENTRGMPLGKKIPTIRSKAYLKANPGADEAFRALGLQLDGKMAANDVRYQRVYNALVRYKELKGDLLVPQPFVIPADDSDWPEEMWGLRLGARVNAIRSQGTFVKTVPERRKQLDDLGFVWDFESVEGGGRGGRRRGRKRKEPNAAFEDLPPEGIFSLDGAKGEQPNAAKEDGVENTYTYSTMDGGTVDYGFASAAAAADPWLQPDGSSAKAPPAPTDLPLWATSPDAWRESDKGKGPASAFSPSSSYAFLDDGDEVDGGGPAEDTNIEELKRFPEYETLQERAEKKALESGIISTIDPDLDHQTIVPRRVRHPWYFDDYGDTFTFDDVVEALTIWGEHNEGTFDIDEKFIIRTDDEIAEITDEELTAALDVFDDAPNDSSDDVFSDQSSLSLQPPLDVAEAEALTRSFSPSLSQYSTIPWPDHLMGLELGSIVRRIREGDVEVKTDPTRRAQLDSIKFDWGDESKFLDVPFEKAMCALFAYFQIRGDLFVYEDFVMPGEDPWPRILDGYELGKVVAHLRERQDLLETTYPEKKSMLDMLEFVWFPQYESRPFLSDFEEEHFAMFGYSQPQLDTMDYVLRDWDPYDETPPIFNFTAAKEYVYGREDEHEVEVEEEELIEELVDDELIDEDDVDVDFDLDEILDEEEDEEEEDEDDDDDDDDIVVEIDEALEQEEAEEDSRRDIMASAPKRDENELYDDEDEDEEETDVDDEDDLEIEGVDLNDDRKDDLLLEEEDDVLLLEDSFDTE